MHWQNQASRLCDPAEAILSSIINIIIIIIIISSFAHTWSKGDVPLHNCLKVSFEMVRFGAH